MIIRNDTWALVDRSEGHEVIGSRRIVLWNKLNQDGTLERRKTRIVARSFSQRPGIDFNETFAPVARLGSIHIISVFAAQYGMKIHQLDVTIAYLHGKLEEKVYMEIPRFSELILEEIIASEKKGKIADKAVNMLQGLKTENKVCLLKKTLYGLRQAGHCWHVKLSNELKNFELRQSSTNPCIFFSGKGEDIPHSSICWRHSRISQ